MMTMTTNTTIRYWFSDSQQCKYMSFPTYELALNAIKKLSTIDVKAEVSL